MPLRLLLAGAAAFAMAACSRHIDGPRPALTTTVNEADPLRTPATVCNAQGDPAQGWIIHLIGDRFSPLPTGTLGKSAGLLMPFVMLSGPEQFQVPDAAVFFLDKTRLPVFLPTRDSSAGGPAPRALIPGSYDVSVTNPNGRSAQLAAGLAVVPPPTIKSVQGQFLAAPSSAAVCNDQAQALVVTGSGFRASAPPTFSFLDAGGSVALTLPPAWVSVDSATVISASLPPGAFAPAQASGTGTQYTAQVTNPEGCKAPYGTDPRGLGVTDVKVFTQCRFQPEIRNNPDSFEFQVTGVQNGSATFLYTWQNSGPRATVDQSSSLAGGSVTLTIKDAAGNLVYSNSLGQNGTFLTAVGSPGAWTIQLDFVNASGTFNFRAQKSG